MEDQNTMLSLTAEIVASYVTNNTVALADLPGLIRTVNQSLEQLGSGEPTPEPEVAKPTAAQIKKSIRSDGLVSFIDGKSYQTLKRHLTTNGMTPASYKERFGLPADYPTTAPDYSARRSAMAKSLGLGRKAADADAPRAKRTPKKS